MTDPETEPPTAAPYDSYNRSDEHAFPDERLHAVLDAIEDHADLQAYLEAQNVNPVTRLGFNDHGTKHIEIVTDRALGLYDLLKREGVTFRGATDRGLETADESVIIVLAATLHDIGHVVHRTNHPHWSVPIALEFLDDLLDEFYDTTDRIAVKSEILHAIVTHHAQAELLTEEAGVVRIADALDMERGRSRRPYEAGGRGINTLSSQAIKQVRLYPGETVPVRVEIEMTSAAGVYQVDSLLKAKVNGSLVSDQIKIVALSSESPEEPLFDRIEL